MARGHWFIFCAIASFIAPQAGADSTLAVREAYVRAAPPGQPHGAAFMTLINTGSTARALVGASSPVSTVVELHTHRHEDGMMRMRRLERIDIPAQGQTVLAPGGLHLMLIGLRQALQPGDQVALTLVFDDGQQLALELPVRASNSMP